MSQTEDLLPNDATEIRHPRVPIVVWNWPKFGRGPFAILVLACLLFFVSVLYFCRLAADIQLKRDMFAAVKNHDKKRVEYLFRHGADANMVLTNVNRIRFRSPFDTRCYLFFPPPQDEQLIIHAARTGTGEITEAILRHGAQINCWDGHEHCTAISAAVQANNIETGRVLLRFGADISIGSRDWSSPICNAIRNGNPEFVRLLLAAHANVNQKDDTGNSAVDYARTCANSKIKSLVQVYAGSPRRGI